MADTDSKKQRTQLGSKWTSSTRHCSENNLYMVEKRKRELLTLSLTWMDWQLGTFSAWNTCWNIVINYDYNGGGISKSIMWNVRRISISILKLLPFPLYFCIVSMENKARLANWIQNTICKNVMYPRGGWVRYGVWWWLNTSTYYYENQYCLTISARKSKATTTAAGAEAVATLAAACCHGSLNVRQGARRRVGGRQIGRGRGAC